MIARGSGPVLATAESAIPIEIVAAMGRNRAIGVEGSLPWNVPSDLARFKAATMGKPMVMGRRTFDSIGKVLPGRDSVVVSRSRALDLPGGVFHAHDLEEAMSLAATRARALHATAIALIGGASLFTALIERADQLTLTIIDMAPTADRFFPAVDPWLWQEVASHAPVRQPNDEAACLFVDFRRRPR